MTLQVFSGKCCLCDVGIPIKSKATFGNNRNELHTGDIVIVWRGNYIGTDIECWNPTGLTVVVSDQYQSYSDGSVIEQLPHKPYVMGIANIGFEHPEWQIQLVKSHTDVIDGEHWKDFGFSYKLKKASEK
jgi:hypothetical protein